MGHITKDHLTESRIAVPNDNLLIEKCGVRVEDILDLVVKNKMQTHELITLRDFLLPLLMNGQVTVKDVEEEILSIAAEPVVEYKKSQP